MVTYPGLGSMSHLLGDAGRLQGQVAIRQPLAEQVKDRFGVDLHGDMISRLQWFSHDGNFVTTSEELHVPLPAPTSAPWAEEVHKAFNFSTVGCTATRSAPHVATASAPRMTSRDAIGADFPSEEL